ncbi:streptomycin biosynthesis protein StrI [Histoplasma capsulatum G186AR]|uniref:Streptomycin biosynthesis protein StrI n=1 Tax=Ajellomyces capsulatus TaxID=5037 RepID=A0A8H8CQX3_AJECA|nr:streptomycin biosynthesis protein StrI [Histoplasma capsulatum]QSS70757.1 streptomycin biosynthesis protein StrI [Histoplasma capsulatum G186AR]
MSYDIAHTTRFCASYCWKIGLWVRSFLWNTQSRLVGIISPTASYGVTGAAKPPMATGACSQNVLTTSTLSSGSFATHPRERLMVTHTTPHNQSLPWALSPNSANRANPSPPATQQIASPVPQRKTASTAPSRSTKTASSPRDVLAGPLKLSAQISKIRSRHTAWPQRSRYS